MEVPNIVHEVLRSPGQSLDAVARSFMEPRFGHDFSQMHTHHSVAPVAPARFAVGAANDSFEQDADAVADRVMRMPAPAGMQRHDFGGVRIHADAMAAESARQLNARAYTVGNHIAFDAGEYAPGTETGRRLLAHELTHVTQQSGSIAANGMDTASTSGGLLQRKWRLDSATPSEATVIDKTDGSGETSGLSLGNKPGSTSGELKGSAETKQTQGFLKQKYGGTAQLARWMTTHYIFKNDGADQDFLQLKMFPEFAGNAKAEDLQYARAASAVWGASIERSASNPTPAAMNLFQIKGGGISAATVGDLGEIEADISLGDKGSVKIKIPLKKVDEGTFAPYSDSWQGLHDVPATVGEVDVLLGARIEADAEIRDDRFGLSPLISRNWNKSFATAKYDLQWQSRAAPGAGAKKPANDSGAGGDSAGSAGIEALKQVTASGRCKCVGDDNCGGGKIYNVCFNTQKDCKKAQKDLDDYCNNNEEMKKKCKRPKCYYRHSDPTCPDKCTP
jgi:hypothetical protein